MIESGHEDTRALQQCPFSFCRNDYMRAVPPVRPSFCFPRVVRPFRKRGDFFLFIWDFVASTVMDNLIDWFYGQIVGFLGNFFSAMGNMGVEIFELEWVQAIVLFFFLSSAGRCMV